MGLIIVSMGVFFRLTPRFVTLLLVESTANAHCQKVAHAAHKSPILASTRYVIYPYILQRRPSIMLLYSPSKRELIVPIPSTFTT